VIDSHDALMATILQTTEPDGRVDLVDHNAIRDSRFYNKELAPVPVAQRNWTTYNYFALWMGMAHNIPSYTLASSLILLGMNWLQAFLTITIGNLVVLAPMLLNSHAGTKYGIPFPVFARAFYGLRGANLAALLRGFIACGWFGIQTWVGGQALNVILGKLFGDSWTNSSMIAGQHWTLWLCFAAFWVVQMLIIWRGMDAIRRFENWTAPLVSVGFLILLGYVLVKAGGFGPILSAPSKLGWGSEFWKVFFPSLMAMIAFWATLSLNMPDFTRFSASQRKQVRGQIFGLPTTMSFIAIVAILTTSGAVVLYGDDPDLWNPALLAAHFSNPVLVIIALVALVLATVSCNLAANVVSPSYDFSNAFPKRISFAVGGLITGVVGVLIAPWRLISDPHVYIFDWLGFYGGVLAAIAGVLIAGYWILDQTRLDLVDLYDPQGSYWFNAGWNWRAVVATVVGAVLAVGGAHGGPFPEDGLIPFLRPLYSYNWAIGLVSAFAVFLALSTAVRDRAPVALLEGEASV
jgi:NCS1 family nucleobase:cation symporter-1